MWHELDRLFDIYLSRKKLGNFSRSNVQKKNLEKKKKDTVNFFVCNKHFKF